MTDTSSKRLLSDGQEVYLCRGDYRIFKATVSSSYGNTVHGVSLDEDHGRFFITRLLQHSSKWDNFDCDIHCVGSAIRWRLSSVKTIKTDKFTDYGTEAQQPKTLEMRKRKRNTQEWKKTVRKEQYNSGYEHEYRTQTGEIKVRPSRRSFEQDCNCRMNCSSKFTEEEKKVVNKIFWDLKDKDLQRAFISKHVKIQEVKNRMRIRHDCKTGKRRHRKPNRIYKLPKRNEDNKLLTVCKIFFTNILNIDVKRVDTALKSKGDGGFITPDKRNNQAPHNTTSEERIAKVVEHIKKFKVVESHYVRKASKFEYLPEELSVAAMHRMYKEWCNEQGYTVESEDFYRNIFKTKFNLKFNKPKKDACDICVSYANTPADLRTKEMEEELQQHIKEKEMARDLKNNLKEQAKLQPSKMVVAAFDMQKTLQSPHGDTSSFYYSRRLKTFNFTITNICTMKPYCFIWNEGDAGKGSCEVATALFQYLNELNLQGVEIVHLFCDRCSGQNCNRMMVIMLSTAINYFNFQQITLNFFVTGHSQNENDTIHSVIETFTKKRHLYSTDDWESAVGMAFVHNRPDVIRMHFSDIIDFKTAGQNPLYKNILTKDTYTQNKTKEKVYWSKPMKMKFNKSEPTKMMFVYHHDEDVYNEIELFKPTRRNNIITDIGQMPKLYTTQPGVGADKIKDLMSLCSRNLIPSAHHSFYKQLVQKK